MVTRIRRDIKTSLRQWVYVMSLDLVGNVGEMCGWCLVVGSEVMKCGGDCFRNQRIT